MRLRYIRPFIATAVLGLSMGALAQDYPAKPIRIVTPFGAGGSTDPVIRTVAQMLTEAWGQPVLVEPRPGGGTNVATGVVVKAPADGYTMLLSVTSLAINVTLYARLPFDPVKDLAPVIQLTDSPNVLAVHPSLPAKTVKELIGLARARPGQLSYASSGSGATNHLAMELFKSMAKIDIVHVPYKGGGQALTDLLGGQIQVMFTPPVSIMPHQKSGRLRALAVGSATRVAGLDLPTVAEAGLPGFESSVWFAIFAPASTPQSIIAKWEGEVNRILKDKSVSERFTRLGLMPVGGTPEDLAALLKNDIGRWGKVVKESGARAD